MDHYNAGNSHDKTSDGGDSKVVRIDLVPADARKKTYPSDDGREIRLYAFLEEYGSSLEDAEFGGHGGLNSCRAVVPLLKALEAANELAACMKVSRRPKESWKLSLLQAEVMKCVMNSKALSKRLEQFHTSLGSRPARPRA